MTVHVLPLVFALFGGSNEDSLDEIAAVLGTDPTRVAVEQEVKSISEAIDAAYSMTSDALDPHRRVSVDADPGEKAAAVRRAVRESRVQRSDADVATGESAPARAAARVSEGRRFGSPLADRLLDQMTGARGGSHVALEETLSSVVEELDACEKSRSELERFGGIDTVSELADAYRTATGGHRRDAFDRDRLVDAVEALVGELDSEADGDADSLERRVRAATRSVRESAATNGDDAGRAEAVERARESVTPRSFQARRLFDALEEGRPDETAGALRAAAKRLDRAATAETLTEGVDPAEVESTLEALNRDLAGVEGALADALRDRVEELSDRLGRIDDSNRVVPFAVREEVRFYRTALVDRFSERGRESNMTGTAGADEQADRIKRLRDRRAGIVTDYVDARPDHNHSIPLYFLSVADASLEEASAELDDGRTREAAGILAAAERILDHIEGLYEQNQYSVMLRSLRG